MYDSTNVIQTTTPAGALLSSFVDQTLLDSNVRYFTGTGYTPSDAPAEAQSNPQGINGWTLFQFGTTQIFQQNGGVWMRSQTNNGVAEQWFTILPILPIANQASGYPYGLTDLTTTYKPVTEYGPLSSYLAPNIYIGDVNMNVNVTDKPTGASGQGFSLEVVIFPTVVSGTTRQGVKQTYTDNAGEWKRATTSTGALSAWVQVATF